MSGASFLTLTWIAWGSVTTVFVALMIWKSLAGMREDDILILDPAQERQAAEKQRVVARVERITLWVKRTGLLSVALLLVSGGIWVYRGVIAFNGGQTP
ncbi:MAG: hypothetical protein LAP40_07660 [Acidobacteriia bacterium]|nr:hypothetical protein [Terriglobia bacterium]